VSGLETSSHEGVPGANLVGAAAPVELVSDTSFLH
jgi:hypothetical protein